MEISEIHKVETAMKILRNRIKGKNLPIIWLEGSENSGKQNHACNISERFGYNHIQIDKMIKDETEKTNRRGRYVNQKVMLQRKIPDVSINFRFLPGINRFFLPAIGHRADKGTDDCRSGL